MARQLRIEFPGAFYHVTSRGNEKKPIFIADRDREKFLGYLELAHQRFKAIILVYCCMENHFHLFIQTPLGNLSRIMHFINTAYTAYFNKIHERTGHLFQGRYKAILVDADNYVRELSRYIHLNPVRAKISELPEQYRWSSYRDYIGQKATPAWLHPEFVLRYFGETKHKASTEYAAFVISLLNQPYKNPLESVGPSGIFGDDLFIERIKKNYMGKPISDREVPGLRALDNNLSRETEVGEIELEAKKVFGKRFENSKEIAIFLIHKYSGKKLKEIGYIFGLSISGASSAVGRVEKEISRDLRFNRKIKEIEERLFLKDM